MTNQRMKNIKKIENRNEKKANEETSVYERLRDERIKENRERMEKLLDLSRKFNSDFSHQNRPKMKHTARKPSFLSVNSPRRSSRLRISRVSHAKELSLDESGKLLENQDVSFPEIYTEQHAKLLGDCKKEWTLFVDGFDEDGQRLYDNYSGKSCHQCRQKTVGHHSHCSKCKSMEGKLCGDCLYTRYGENVLESKENPNWICPFCRGICNCSRCRHAKGWLPVRLLKAEVEKLGFKSVAHYLIETRNSQQKQAKLEPSIEVELSKTQPEEGRKEAVEEGRKEAEEEGRKEAMEDGRKEAEEEDSNYECSEDDDDDLDEEESDSD
ncbi:cell division cycle-associated protein 7-like [Impatiens glandulifera]|uniref:cell division cycle-associated protein 7-like n=1 Tax=Impatiens glandulifera TaxID=253017 RepID=UPI001FB18739|nr:cell division cycle-associated protein 7-like [Impatiens glandulifera]